MINLLNWTGEQVFYDFLTSGLNSKKVDEGNPFFHPCMGGQPDDPTLSIYRRVEEAHRLGSGSKQIEIHNDDSVDQLGMK